MFRERVNNLQKRSILSGKNLLLKKIFSKRFKDFLKSFLLISIIILFPGCKACDKDRNPVFPEENLIYKQDQLSNINISEDKVLDIISNEIKQNKLKASSKSISIFSASKKNLYFSLKKIETYVSPDGATGYIKYAFVYKEGLLSGNITTYKGTITFNYKWIDTSPKHWEEVSYTINTKENVFGTIKGRVLNAITKKALDDVTVYGEDISHTPSARTLSIKTNKEGNFTLDDVISGNYTLYAHKEEYDLKTIKDTKVEKKDKTTKIGDIFLLPNSETGEDKAATLKGRILNLDNKAQINAPIYLEKKNENIPLPNTKTDNDGNFILDKVFYGEYILKIRTGDKLITSKETTVDKVLIDLGDIKVNNHAPVITSLTAEKTTVKPKEEVKITCTASDPDYNLLYYYWSSNDHTDKLSLTFEKEVARAVSQDPGTYTITVMVKDKKGGEVNKSVEVRVRVE